MRVCVQPVMFPKLLQVVHNLASSPCMHALYLPGYPGFPVLQKSRIQVNEYKHVWTHEKLVSIAGGGT